MTARHPSARRHGQPAAAPPQHVPVETRCRSGRAMGCGGGGRALRRHARRAQATVHVVCGRACTCAMAAPPAAPAVLPTCGGARVDELYVWARRIFLQAHSQLIIIMHDDWETPSWHPPFCASTLMCIHQWMHASTVHPPVDAVQWCIHPSWHPPVRGCGAGRLQIQHLTHITVEGRAARRRARRHEPWRCGGPAAVPGGVLCVFFAVRPIVSVPFPCFFVFVYRWFSRQLSVRRTASREAAGQPGALIAVLHGVQWHEIKSSGRRAHPIVYRPPRARIGRCWTPPCGRASTRAPPCRGRRIRLCWARTSLQTLPPLFFGPAHHAGASSTSGCR